MGLADRQLLGALLQRGASRQILVSGHVAAAVETLIEAEEVGALRLKELARPVSTWSVVGLQ